jgi:hypothetical protein
MTRGIAVRDSLARVGSKLNVVERVRLPSKGAPFPCSGPGVREPRPDIVLSTGMMGGTPFFRIRRGKSFMKSVPHH